MPTDIYLLLTSGSEWTPSHGNKSPLRLRKRSKEKAGADEDFSHVDPNEKDADKRELIKEEEGNYRKRMSLFHEWTEVIRSLGVLDDGKWLSEKVICNQILDQWWIIKNSYSRRSPIYLAYAEVDDLSRGLSRKGHIRPRTFDTGPFKDLYRSVAFRENDKCVCFFLHRNQLNLTTGKRTLESSNHFFPVLFDYGAHTAHAFGCISTLMPEVRVERGRDSSWASWLGPELWTAIGSNMGWQEEDVCNPDKVRVVTKNWRQVCRNLAFRRGF